MAPVHHTETTPLTTRIRPATIQDDDVIIAMARRFVMESAYGRILTVDPDRLADLVRLVLVQEAGCVFLAEAETEMTARLGDERVRFNGWTAVGMIAAIAGPHPISGAGTIEEMAWWVDPEARASGVGHQLLRSLEDWGRQEGHAMLKMVAPADAPAVGRVYERLGYRAIETVYVKVFADGAPLSDLAAETMREIAGHRED